MKNRRVPAGPCLILWVLGAGLAGCLSTPGNLEHSRKTGAAGHAGKPVQPGPSGSDSAAPAETPPPHRLDGPLEMEEAERLALHHHPEIAAALAQVEAATGRKIQAGAFPNPLFTAYIESAPFSGRTTGDAEYPLGIIQTVPLGGRLGAAAEVEELRRRKLLHELDGTCRKVLKRVRGAFAAALFTRDTLEVERRLYRGAEEAARIARQRTEAGDASSEEQARAELEAARAKISISRAELANRRALLELQSAMGHEGLRIAELRGDLEATLALPELRIVLERVQESPLLMARRAAIEEGQARVLHEEARRIPDIDIGFFYRRVQSTEANAFDLGFSIPLPIFDRRQGGLREARSRLLEARADHRAAEASVTASVKNTYWKLKQELEAARLYREELSPRSETVLRVSGDRYRAGETSLAELIPIRRDHRELELAHLNLLRQIALDWAELRSMISNERRSQIQQGTGSW